MHDLRFALRQLIKSPDLKSDDDFADRTTLATWPPARRTTKVNPVEALRSE